MSVGRPFQKGQSGNPGGRSRGLERRVRDLLGDDIDRMTTAMRDIVLGVPPGSEAGGNNPFKDLKITTRDRIEAFKVLTDRGWGKARAVVDLSGSVNLGKEVVNYQDLSDEQLNKLIEAEAIALGSTTTEVPDGDDSDLDGTGDGSEPTPAG